MKAFPTQIERPLARRAETKIRSAHGFPKISEIDAKAHIANLPKNHVLIYSPTGAKKLGIEAEALGMNAISDKGISILLSDLEMVRLPEWCDEITVFAAGRAIDHAKYLAHKHSKKLNIIPSLLSTNAFGTPFGCYENSADSDTRVTLHTGFADQILVDFEYLRSAGKRDMYGLSDVLSIATALHDWDLAADRDASVSDAMTYQMARATLDVGFKMIESRALDAQALFALLLDTAYTVGLHGSGRPESGSEHIFSKTFEIQGNRQGMHIMHGQSVGLGIVLMATLQENPELHRLVAAIRYGQLFSESADDRAMIEHLAAESLARIEPHSRRHTIVNERLKYLKSKHFREALVHKASRHIFGRIAP